MPNIWSRVWNEWYNGRIDDKSWREQQNVRERSTGWEGGLWWRRRWSNSYIPALHLGNKSVKDFLISHGLID